MTSRFHLIPERYGETYRRTDGQTDSQTDKTAISILRVSVLTRDKNVRIIVLPSHSCEGTLQSLYAQLLNSSTQTLY